MSSYANSRRTSHAYSSVLKLLFLLLIGTLLVSCVKTPEDNSASTGSITGRVTNLANGLSIAGAQITTSPTSASVTTGSDGRYSINNLEPGQYSVFASKANFTTNSVIVNVSAGQSATGDIRLSEASAQFIVTPTIIDFGAAASNIIVELSNPSGTSAINWSVSANRSWIHYTPSQGTLTDHTQSVTVSVVRDSMLAGNYVGNLIFSSNVGNPVVEVRMSVANSTTPQLTVSQSLMNFDSTSNSQALTIRNTGTGALNWSLVSDQTWLVVLPSSGTIPTGGSHNCVVNVGRTGLAGGAYTGRLTVTSNGGATNITVLMSVNVPAPTAPSNLRATLGSGRSINLLWNDNASSEEGFRIERRLSTQSSFSTHATVSANTTTYLDSGLIAHRRYIYRVLAFNQTRVSGYSNADSATIGNLAPNAAINPVPSDLSTNQACSGTLRWTGYDPDLDTLQYDLYMGYQNPPNLYLSNRVTASQNYPVLYSDSTLYWSILSKDNYGGQTSSPVWRFRTTQPLGITFSAQSNMSASQEGRSVWQTFDRGYVCTGFTGSSPTNHDLWAAKYSENGILEWERRFGTELANERGNCIRQLNDGGFIIVGSTQTIGNPSDIWVLKLSATGDTTWTRVFGGTGEDTGWGVTLTQGYELVFVGITYSFGNNGQIYLIKSTVDGNIVWQQNYGGTNYDGAFSIVEASDGGYVVGGFTTSTGNNTAWYMMKTNNSGGFQWGRTYGTGASGAVYSIAKASNNEYFLTGDGVNTSGNHDAWLIRTDVSGNQLWLRTVGGTGMDYGNCVGAVGDGGAIVSGMTELPGAGTQDGILIRYTATGDTAWTRQFGSAGEDKAIGVSSTIDNGFVSIGKRSNGVGANSNVWLLKTDVNGNLNRNW